ncbi:acyl-CoA thioesterase [Liquorilactobacillus cacaonum]|uniref:Acyl-CoA hydrolase n=1 Tax=Liquorilactobacillus cacaonum DSM 21116 TaxID=1423729 RepID=A0A0R2CM93_9LACO|nr:acyl-CoA hydrolase [Liquorilactobacillus cacaonum DSM 21116]
MNITDSIYCSQTIAITEQRVLTGDLNEHGTVFGGHLLELLDGTASISAARVARCNIVTAAINQFNFITPLKLDDALTIKTFVSGIGNSSIEVFAKFIGEHLVSGERFLVATSFLTFVITDTQHKSLKLIPQSSEEIMICKAYQKRRLEYQKNIATSKEINNLLAFD